MLRKMAVERWCFCSKQKSTMPGATGTEIDPDSLSNPGVQKEDKPAGDRRCSDQVSSPCGSPLKDSCNSAGGSELPFQATTCEMSSFLWKHSP